MEGDIGLKYRTLGCAPVESSGCLPIAAHAFANIGFTGDVPDDVLLDDLHTVPAACLPADGVQVVVRVAPGSVLLYAEVLKSEAATVTAPNIGLELQPGTARYCTLHDLIADVLVNLESMAAGMSLAAAADGLETARQLLSDATRGLVGFTVSVCDPLGLSFVRPPTPVLFTASGRLLGWCKGLTPPLDVSALPGRGPRVVVHGFSRPFESRLEYDLLDLTATADLAEYLFYVSSVCLFDRVPPVLKKLVASVRADFAAGRRPQLPAFHTQLYPDMPPQLRTAVAAAQTRGDSPAPPILPLLRPLHPDVLKVGYVGATFRNDPVGHLVWDLFAAHATHSGSNALVYALTPHDGSVYRQRIEDTAGSFFDASGCTDADLARRIAADGVDVLVEMSGLTLGARFNALAAAGLPPIRAVHAAAYPATLGVPSVVTHMVVDRPSWPEDDALTEAPLFMPHTFFVNGLPGGWPLCVNDDDAAAWTGAGRLGPGGLGRLLSGSHWLPGKQCPMVGATPGGCGGSVCVHAACRAGAPPVLERRRAFFGDVVGPETVVLGSLSQLSRIDVVTFTCWCRVLIACPRAVLVLLALPLAGEGHLRSELQALCAGDAVQRRLVFVAPLPKMRHIERAAHLDLCLDTPKRNGHTVTVDVLWAGVPVVTLPTRTLAGRVVGGLLRALGMEECVGASWEAYERLIVDLVGSPARMAALKATLIATRRTSPLFDTPQYVDDFVGVARAALAPLLDSRI